MTDTPTIAQQLASLETATTDDLIKQYVRLHKKAPRTRNRPWLVKKIAWALQAEAFGGLSPKVRSRLDQLIAQIGPLGSADRTVLATLQRTSKPNAPPVGSTLTREWRGQQIVVHVRDNGYEHAGILYRSLTGLATAVTGSHWNGRLFFGLVDRRKKAS